MLAYRILKYPLLKHWVLISLDISTTNDPKYITWDNQISL